MFESTSIRPIILHQLEPQEAGDDKMDGWMDGYMEEEGGKKGKGRKQANKENKDK